MCSKVKNKDEFILREWMYGTYICGQPSVLYLHLKFSIQVAAEVLLIESL